MKLSTLIIEKGRGLKTTGNKGEAIATGLKQARAHFAKEKRSKKTYQKAA